MEVTPQPVPGIQPGHRCGRPLRRGPGRARCGAFTDLAIAQAANITTDAASFTVTGAAAQLAVLYQAVQQVGTGTSLADKAAAAQFTAGAQHIQAVLAC